ncbi:MAG: DUF6538 domain-containing protein [Bacteroidota bacterium]
MVFLARIGTRYYYNRRVPEELREYDPRTLVRVSLKTDSKRLASRKAAEFNSRLEDYWQGLVATDQPHMPAKFRQTVRVARQMGFAYQSMSEVAALPLRELIDRVLALRDATPIQVDVALGAKEGSPVPQTTVQDALEKFWEITADKVMNKTEAQLRKWRNPRIKAVKNFIRIAGNKQLKNLMREDIVAFRDWWIIRVQEEDISPETANKDFIHLKGVLEAVSDHEKLDLNIEHLFKKLALENRFQQIREPFTDEQIKAVLHSPKLENTHKECQLLLSVMAETGARPSELAGLLPEDICLDAPVPHISIKDRKERPLKNKHSQRVIPLVGYALDALRKMPNGFEYYRDRVDSMTTAINKFLRANEMMPSENHSLYSLRHSFQDRILSVDTPDRIQAELMGHRFQRPKYGKGGTLEHKREWLNKVCLKN